MDVETSVVQVFTHEDFGAIRTFVVEGKVWAVAADVCRALGLKNVTKALDSLDEDEKMTLTNSEGHFGQRGGAQFFNVINEPGLYRLIFRSRKPLAKKFQRWIYHEVIPAAVRGEKIPQRKKILIPSDWSSLNDSQKIGCLLGQIDDDDFDFAPPRQKLDEDGRAHLVYEVEFTHSEKYDMEDTALDYNALCNYLKEKNARRQEITLREEYDTDNSGDYEF